MTCLTFCHSTVKYSYNFWGLMDMACWCILILPRLRLIKKVGVELKYFLLNFSIKLYIVSPTGVASLRRF